MPRKAAVKYRSLRSNLVHLPLSLYAQLAQTQTRPQGVVIHLAPVSPTSSARPPQTAYLGWTGLSASSSLPTAGSGVETVELDPEVAMSYGWPEGTILELSVIHAATPARSISVTPLSPDDWEILNANYLEENLLAQLRAARRGQEIDIWVIGRTKIRIRVDNTDPSSGETSVVLLTRDTEVYVAPNPRATDKRVIENAAATEVGPYAKGKGREVELRLVPPRVATSWGHPEVGGVPAGGKIALAGEDTLKWIRAELGYGPGAMPVHLTRRTESRPGVAGQGEDQDAAPDTVVDVWLLAWDEVPAGCVVLAGGVDEDWAKWATVNLRHASRPRGVAGETTRLALDQDALSDARVLAGIDKVLYRATSFLTRAALSGSPRPLLLLGAKGAGKTRVAQAVARQLEADRSVLAETLYVDIGKLSADEKVSAIRQTMQGWLDDAAARAPCCLILDGLDALLGPENELTPSSNAATLADTFCRTFRTSNMPENVLVMATGTGTASLHPLLGTKHVFGDTVKIPPFDKETRRVVLQSIVTEQAKDGHAAELDFISLANMTEGYTASDLCDLAAAASQQAMIRSLHSTEHPTLSLVDFQNAQEAFTPQSLRGVALHKSDVGWGDIGGLVEPRRLLRETLEWPTRYAPLFARCPLRLRSGILLYGYPGCGKTLLASAVARECGLNFISVKGPEILNKYIGASEQAVRDLFERASAAKPCVLFFDEFDSVAPRRGHDSTGVTDRVVNQLLTEMDGAQGLEGVYVLAATSRPDLIDPALLRPGRLDKAVLCDMPAASDRREILLALSKKIEVDSVDWDELGALTAGFSGADLQAVLYNAHLEAVHEGIAEREEETAMSLNADTDAKGKGKGKGKIGGKGKVREGDHDDRPNGHDALAVRVVQPDLGHADRAKLIARVEAMLGTTSSSATAQAKAAPPAVVVRHAQLVRSAETTRPSVSPSERARLDRIYREFTDDREGPAGPDMGTGTGTRVSLM